MQVDEDHIITGGIINTSVKDQGQLGGVNVAEVKIVSICASHKDLGGPAHKMVYKVIVVSQGSDGSTLKPQFIFQINHFIDGAVCLENRRTDGKYISCANVYKVCTSGLYHQGNRICLIVCIRFIACHFHLAIDAVSSRNSGRPGDGNINDSTSFDRGSVHRSQHGVILPHELYQIVVLHISAVIVQADSIERLFSRYGGEITADAHGTDVVLQRRDKAHHDIWQMTVCIAVSDWWLQVSSPALISWSIYVRICKQMSFSCAIVAIVGFYCHNQACTRVNEGSIKLKHLPAHGIESEKSLFDHCHSCSEIPPG